MLEIFARPQASLHERPARLPAAARNDVPPPADGRRLHGNAYRERRSPRHRKEDGRRAAQATLEARAAAGCCIPKSELAAIGHPWEEGHHAPDTQTVAEGTEPLLRVENLQVYFPVRRGILARAVDHVQAVDGISFNVYRGQTLGLVGESGCGKTTTGRAILRLIEPTGGRVLYNGADVALDRRARARAIAASKCKSSFRIRTARSTRG